MSTDTLIDFLVSEGAEVADGVVVSFANEPAHDAAAAGLKVPLRSYGVVAVTGDDAEAFLQGQFAGDCQALAVGASMLTAWCNPKGRVIVLVHLIRSDAGFHLLVEREQLAAFRQRLSMFVLRADVVIEDLSASHGVVQIETVDGDAASFDAGDLIMGRSAAQTWLVATLETLRASWPAFPGAAAGESAARLREIRHGLPRLDAALSERFLPQELNLDLLGGLSFDKGCFSGQEIIARVKYRGQVVRRLYRLRLAAAATIAPATEIIAGDDGGKVGTVVSAAAAGDTVELLAVITRAHAADALALQTYPGAVLTPAPLPYVRPAGR